MQGKWSTKEKQEVLSQELQINYWDMQNYFTDVGANVLWYQKKERTQR